MELKDRYGDDIPPDILELAYVYSRRIKDYVESNDDIFGNQRIDMARLKIQSMLVDMAAEIVRADRNSGSNFFGTASPADHKPLLPELRTGRRPPPLYNHLMKLRTRLNGHGWRE